MLAPGWAGLLACLRCAEVHKEKTLRNCPVHGKCFFTYGVCVRACAT